MSFIYSIKTDVPAFKHTQIDVYNAIAPHFPQEKLDIVKRIFTNAQVESRYFGADISTLVEWTANNKLENKFRLWEQESMQYFGKQIEETLNQSGLDPLDIDAICVNSSTGMMVPDLGVLLADRFGFRSDITRYPFFGYACGGGIMALNRMIDYLKLYPKKCVLFCCGETVGQHVELEYSMNSIIHDALFGDGYATLLLVGAEHPLSDSHVMEFVGTSTHLATLGRQTAKYHLGDGGFKGHLGANLPEVIRKNIAIPLNKLKAEVQTEGIDNYVFHYGGPKIMDVVQEELGLTDEDVAISRHTYRSRGNQSSVSVLSCLDETLKRSTEKGTALMMAVAPGITIEMIYCNMVPKQNVKETANRHELVAV